MTHLAAFILGIGLILVADIIRNVWKSRSDQAQARLASIKALAAALPPGRARMAAIAETFTAAPRVMTDGEVRRINRKLRRQT